VTQAIQTLAGVQFALDPRTHVVGRRQRLEQIEVGPGSPPRIGPVKAH
jgi:hypothetical protein